MTFAGEDITALSPNARARRGIGYVPQGRDIFADLTVQENLRIGLVARDQGQQPIAPEILQLFPVLPTMFTRKGGVLSGGQQQQLAIARALMTQPTLLLLDEPTEGIQPSIILEIEAVIRRLKDSGKMGILLVEQYLDFASRLADHVYVMEKGAIVFDGTLQAGQDDVVKRYLAV